MSTDLVFAIESIGVAGATDRQLYFAKGVAPSWDSDSAWVESCWSDFPSEISSVVSFFDGDSSIGSLSLELFAMAQTQSGSTIASILYNQIRVSLGELTQALTASDTDVYLSTSTLSGRKVVIGREVIALGTYSGGRYQGSTRGLLGTSASSHGVSASDFVQVFDASKGPILNWRRVTLYRRAPDAASYADLDALWSGVITGVSAPSPERLRIDLDSALSAIEGSVILSQQARAIDVNGEGVIFKIPTPDIVGSVADALFCADGEVVVKDAQDLLTGLTWVYLLDARIQRALDAPGRPQVIPDQPKDVYQVFYASGDRSTSTSSLPLSRNLLTCFLQLLTTTTTGTNGDFDVGATSGADILGLAIPKHLVDFATIKRIRDSLGDALETDLLLFGLDGSPLDVIDFFRTALRPFGVAIIDKAGLISVASLQDNDPDATTLDESTDLVGPAGIPETDPVAQVRRLDMCVDAYSVSFSQVPGHDLITDRFVNVARRLINIYGEKNAPTLELPFFSSRDKVTSVILPLLQRFDDPIPELTLTALRTRVDIELGDLVKLTHSKVFNATGGTRGVTDALCLCVERTLDLSSNLLTLRLLFVGAIYARSGLIAPSAVVDSVVGSTITLYENYLDDARAFQSGLEDATGAGQYDITNFIQGDVIDHCDSTGAVYQQLTISSLTSPTTIVVTPSPSPAPARGDVLRLGSYDDVATARQDRFAWLADSNGELGSGNDPGKEYTF